MVLSVILLVVTELSDKSASAIVPSLILLAVIVLSTISSVAIVPSFILAEVTMSSFKKLPEIDPFGRLRADVTVRVSVVMELSTVKVEAVSPPPKIPLPFMTRLPSSVKTSRSLGPVPDSWPCV